MSRCPSYGCPSHRCSSHRCPSRKLAQQQQQLQQHQEQVRQQLQQQQQREQQRLDQQQLEHQQCWPWQTVTSYPPDSEAATPAARPPDSEAATPAARPFSPLPEAVTGPGPQKRKLLTPPSKPDRSKKPKSTDIAPETPMTPSQSHNLRDPWSTDAWLPWSGAFGH